MQEQQGEQQGRLFREQEEECNLWLTQNVNPRKTASVMVMLEQMVETRAWKAARGLIEDGRCRVCQEQVETVERNKKTGKAHQISSAGIRNERETFRVRNNSCARDYWSLRWRYEKDDE